MPIRTVSLIGAGRVATHLGLRLTETGVAVNQVYSRTLDSARKLSDRLGSEPVNHLSGLDGSADLFIISVVDDAVAQVADQLPANQKIVVHTSGSVPMDVLNKASVHHGVFYPLQSFSHGRKVDFSEIPLCIEASDEATKTKLLALSGKLSRDVRLIDSSQRASIHLSAVFASNFSNLMYLLGEEVLEKAGVSFDILLPLIRETAGRLEGHDAREMQTGPAVRNDRETIKKHLELLGHDPAKKDIYDLLSKYIINEFNA